MSLVYCPYCHECVGVGAMAEDVIEQFHARCLEMQRYDNQIGEAMSNKNDRAFLVRDAKFVPRSSDEPVVGWVTVSGEVKRAAAEQVQRAVVISEADVALLKSIRGLLESASDTEDHVALVDRLIGKG